MKLAVNAFRNPVFKLYLCFLSHVLQRVTQVNQHHREIRPDGEKEGSL
jgi:hypothetical protein